MNNSSIKSMVLFGSGNVGTHLAQVMMGSGVEIRQIYSRNPENARNLASKKEVSAISSIEEADTTADLWLISVTDDAVGSIAQQLPDFSGIVAHTAGSISIDVLNRFQKRGVFYPFQTFSKHREVNYNEVPFLIEGSDEDTTGKLLRLAGILSTNVSEADSELRATLHVAAVLSCNFVNHLYTLSAELLQNAGLSFKYLTPLIKETTQKVLYISPYEAQTGPAIRNDQTVMDKQVNRLVTNPPLQQIYRMLSEDILRYHNNKQE